MDVDASGTIAVLMGSGAVRWYAPIAAPDGLAAGVTAAKRPPVLDQPGRR
jgi:hypothetical protein